MNVDFANFLKEFFEKNRVQAENQNKNERRLCQFPEKNRLQIEMNQNKIQIKMNVDFKFKFEFINAVRNCS